MIRLSIATARAVSGPTAWSWTATDHGARITARAANVGAGVSADAAVCMAIANALEWATEQGLGDLDVCSSNRAVINEIKGLYAITQSTDAHVVTIQRMATSIKVCRFTLVNAGELADATALAKQAAGWGKAGVRDVDVKQLMIQV